MSPHERANERAAQLPAFSLRRRVTVLVLLASVLVLGAVALKLIPLELIPRGFDDPFLQVATPWQDAPGEEVVDKVIRPLEEELATVAGIKRMFSIADTGFGRISISFKQGTDMDIAYREVRDRIERARTRLPEDIEQIHIRKHDDNSIPVAVYGLSIPPEITNSYDLVEHGIVLPLKRIDGVADVQVRGQMEKEILIELDRNRTQAAGLNIYQLAQELGADNFALSSGTVRDGDRKLLLRSVARYGSVEELENRWVAPSVRLRDIATVKYEQPEKTFQVRAMSMPAVALQIFQEGDANTLEVAARVAWAMEQLQEDPRVAKITVTTLFNQGEVISDSLSTLLDSGRVGGLFAILVLFFFLRRFRMTLIITLSIPLSILVAITVMYFAGETLNILSLLGLMISVGLLVDNSVVVAENIFRMHRDGLPRREACIRGSAEIALAITMATLTTIIVFVPVSLVEGQGQFFLLRLSLPITISLAASLIVALVLIPLAVYLTLPTRGAGKQSGAFAVAHERLNGVLRQAYDASLGRMNDGYGSLLQWAARRRLDVLLALLVVFVLTFGVFQENVKMVESQDDEIQGFWVGVELPQDTTLEESNELFGQLEKIVESHRDEWSLDGWFLFNRATRGEVQGWFASDRDSELSPREVTDALVELLPEKPGVEYFTGQESEDEDGNDTFRLTLFGEDPKVLEQVAADMKDVMVQVPGVLGIEKSADAPMQEVGLIVDRDRAQRLGVEPQTIAGLVGYSLRGQALPRYSKDGREIPVRVRFQESDRESLAQLEDFAVPTASGDAVSLRSLTDVSFLPSTRRIWRRDRQTAESIALQLVDGEEEETREQLMSLARGWDLPEGVRLGQSKREQMDEELQSLLFALGLSIAFIYLLMAFLFESFVLPLSIVATIPLAFIGVAWAHVLAGIDMDFLGIVAMVLLVGIVVNNGIVLIDYVNRLREVGHERAEALLLAAHRRFRPIMMTALTTICGMVPLLFGGANEIGLSYTSFAWSLIGGLITATLLTLLVVPVFYTLFDDLGLFLQRVLRQAIGRGQSGAVEIG